MSVVPLPSERYNHPDRLVGKIDAGIDLGKGGIVPVRYLPRKMPARASGVNLISPLMPGPL